MSDHKWPDNDPIHVYRIEGVGYIGHHTHFADLDAVARYRDKYFPGRPVLLKITTDDIARYWQVAHAEGRI